MANRILIVGSFLLGLLLISPARASIIIPPGLQPGDTYHLVFTTSTITNISTANTVPPIFPGFGSVEGADWIVTYSAYSAGMLPDWDGLELEWMAIISSSTVDVRDRLDIQGPIFNMQGQLVATGAPDLFDGSISASVAYDEFGNPITTATRVWTGSLATGFRSSDTAQNWTTPTAAVSAQTGQSISLGSSWLQSLAIAGSETARLYAFSPAFTVPLGESTVPEPSSLVIFTTAFATLLLGSRRLRQRPSPGRSGPCSALTQ